MAGLLFFFDYIPWTFSALHVFVGGSIHMHMAESDEEEMQESLVFSSNLQGSHDNDFLAALKFASTWVPRETVLSAERAQRW